MTFISLPHLFTALLTTPLATTPFTVDSDGEIIVPLADEVHYTLNGEPVEVNSVIWVETLCHGRQPGYVYAIVDNPYYGQTGLCAYVVSFEGEPFWTDYLPLEVVVS